MGEFYRTFLKKNISLEPYGLYSWGGGDELYFCTPRGASVIGRTGVDSIHYCFVRGYGETVFAVSPCNAPGEYVHPVARNFEEFLGLLAACKGEAALEQSWMWDREKFERFISEQETTPELLAANQRLLEELGVTPEQYPFQCLKEVREEVNCSGLKFRGETDEPEVYEPPVWEVRFGDQGRPGREIFLRQTFQWGGREWYVPSAYVCGKGLVVDFCINIPAEEMQAFLDRWARSEEEEPALTQEEREQRLGPIPGEILFTPTAWVNDRALRRSMGTNRFWCGCLEGADQERQAESWMEHYHLSRSCCWTFWRYSFPWSTSRRPELRSLWVELSQEPVERCGQRFTVTEAGQQFPILHPVTGEVYTLNVLRFDPDKLENSADCGQSIPECLRRMEYSLTPELPEDEFSLRDCASDDQPRAIERLNSMEAEALLLIGGADGPTAYVVSDRDYTGENRLALSSLHYEEVNRVEWLPVFRVKTAQDIKICLGER